MHRYTFLAALALVCATGATFFFGGQSSVREADARAAEYTLTFAADAPLPELTAESWYVFNAETGEPLLSHDATTARPIASISKLVSAAAFFDRADLAATTTITWGDLNTFGEAGRLRYGDELTYHQLLFPLLMESSNDAATAMERLDGELVAEMNALADRAGAVATFADASGLSLQNRASAEAVGKLGGYLFQRYPHLFDISLREEHLLSDDRGWVNNNPLLGERAYRGGKHGYLPEAGRTALAFFEEEVAGERFLVGYVVLGSGPLPASISALRQHVATYAQLR